MPELKIYTLEIRANLREWDPVQVRLRAVLPPGSHPGDGALSPQFEVLDAMNSPHKFLSTGLLQIEGKKRLAAPNELEFWVKATGDLGARELPDTCHLEVRVLPETPGAAGAMGAAMALGGGGFMGGMAGASAATQMLSATCVLRIQKPVIRLTAEKFRWDRLENEDITSLLDAGQIKHLHENGGCLEVPIFCQWEQTLPSQETKPGEETYAPPPPKLRFGAGQHRIRVCDLTAELDWMGQKLQGFYSVNAGRDLKREVLLFRVPAKGTSPPPGDFHGGDRPDVTCRPVELPLAVPILNRLFQIQKGVHHAARQFSGRDLGFQKDLDAFQEMLAHHLAVRQDKELRDPENTRSFNLRLIRLSVFFSEVPMLVRMLARSFLLRHQVEKAAVAALADLSMNCMQLGMEHWKKNTPEVETAPKVRYEEFTENRLVEIRTRNRAKAAADLQTHQTRFKEIETRMQELMADEATLKKNLGAKGFDQFDANVEKQLLEGADPPARDYFHKIRAEQYKLAQEGTLLRAQCDAHERLIRAMDDPVWQRKNLLIPKRLELAYGVNGVLKHDEILAQATKEQIETVGAWMESACAGWKKAAEDLPAGERAAMLSRIESEARLWRADLANKTAADESAKNHLVSVLKSQIGEKAIGEIGEVHAILRQQEAEKKKGWMESISEVYWAVLQPIVLAGRRIARSTQSEESWLKISFYGVVSFCQGIVTSLIQIIAFVVKGIVAVVKMLLDAVLNWLGIPSRKVSNISNTWIYEQGLKAAKEKGALNEGFFTREGQDNFLVEFLREIRPDSNNFGSGDTSAEADLRTARYLRDKAMAACKTRGESEDNMLAEHQATLLRAALDADRLFASLPNHGEQAREGQEALRKVLDPIVNNIQTYERALASAGPPPVSDHDAANQWLGDDLKRYAETLYKEAEKIFWEGVYLEHSWANLDNYLKLLGSHCAQAARVAAFALSKHPYTLAATPYLATFAEVTDNLTSLVRVVIAECGMKPNVDAFACDLLVYQGLSWEVLVNNRIAASQVNSPPGVPDVPIPTHYPQM